MGYGMTDAPIFHYFVRPMVNVPYFSHNLGSYSSAQWYECGKFELQWIKCMDAYGFKLGRRYCHLEARDFHECTYQDKSRARFAVIQDKKRSQFLHGERTWPNWVKDHVGKDTYQPDYHKYSRPFEI